MEYAGIRLDGSAAATRALARRIGKRAGALGTPPQEPIPEVEDQEPEPLAADITEERPEK